MLLILGGLLLAVAAIAFTLFSWGELGIAGRSVVLAGVTAGALGAPVLLLRRGLGATAESVGAVALLLTVLDAYALHAAVLPEADGAGYAAFASGVLAAGWAAYGVGVGRLRLPLPAAVVAGQFPLVLGAWAAGGSALVIGWALLVTAAGSVVVAARVPVLAVRATAWSGAGVTWAGGLLIGLGESVSASGPLDAAAPGVLLLGAAAVALRAVWRAPQEMAVTGEWWPGWRPWPESAGCCVPRCRGAGRSWCIWCAGRRWRRWRGSPWCRDRCAAGCWARRRG